MSNKEKVVIFGAGAAGINAYHMLKKKYEILSFVDNNHKKHGTKLLGFNIIAAEEIRKQNPDRVFIASSYQYQIFKQLIDGNIIDRTKIEFVPKSTILGRNKVYYIAFLTNVGIAIIVLFLMLFFLFRWI